MTASTVRYLRPPAPERRLATLTAEQERAVDEWREEWLRVGMSTQPADRARAERAIRAMCARIGRECPPIVWVAGPATMVLTYAVMRTLSSAGSLADSLTGSLAGSLTGSLAGSLRVSLAGSLAGSLRDSLDGSLADSLRDSLADSLADSLDGSLADSLADSLDASLRDSLTGSLDASLADSLAGSLDGSLAGSLADSLADSLTGSLAGSLDGSLAGSLDGSLDGSLADSLGDSLGGSLDDLLWWRMWWFSGQHSLAWQVFYAFCHDVLSVGYAPGARDDLQHWLDIGRSCGWWRPRDGIVWVCERPAVQTLDQDGRLHNETGPAILCRDGWAVWAICGVRVTRQIVEAPDTLTVEQISGEENVEVRRVMIDRYGAERYLRAAGAELVDEAREPPFPGLVGAKLWRLAQADDEPLQMVEMVNSTREPDGSFKRYFERVPPDVESVRVAVAWRFGLDAGEYAPVVET